MATAGADGAYACTIPSTRGAAIGREELDAGVARLERPGRPDAP
ncbi:hypothetical protein ACFY64_11290 [Streptomyces collinus]